VKVRVNSAYADAVLATEALQNVGAPPAAIQHARDAEAMLADLGGSRLSTSSLHGAAYTLDQHVAGIQAEAAAFLDPVTCAKKAFGEMSRDQVKAKTEELLHRDPDSMDVLDWAYLYEGSIAFPQLVSDSTTIPTPAVQEELWRCAEGGPVMPQLRYAMLHRTTPRAEVVERVRSLVSRRQEPMSRDDIDELRVLVQSKNHGDDWGPLEAEGLAPLDNVLNGLRRKDYSAEHSARIYFKRWQVALDPANRDPDMVRTKFARLLLDGKALSESDFAELNGLLMDTAPGRELPWADGLPPRQNVELTIAELASQETFFNRNISEQMRLWLKGATPDYDARIRTAVAEVIEGREPSQLDGALLMLEGAPKGLESDRQTVIDLWRLAQPRRVELKEMARFVSAADAVLDRVGSECGAANPMVRAVIADTKALIEVNRIRLSGGDLPDELTGFGQYPNYGEIGQIRTNLRMVLHFLQSQDQL
jgi:hypothetical protein